MQCAGARQTDTGVFFFALVVLSQRARLVARSSLKLVRTLVYAAQACP